MLCLSVLIGARPPFDRSEKRGCENSVKSVERLMQRLRRIERESAVDLGCFLEWSLADKRGVISNMRMRQNAIAAAEARDDHDDNKEEGRSLTFAESEQSQLTRHKVACAVLKHLVIMVVLAALVEQNRVIRRASIAMAPLLLLVGFHLIMVCNLNAQTQHIIQSPIK